MPIQQGVWGIDLGQCALKALRMEVIDGQLTATAFDYVEHPKILSQPDADPDQLTREALEKFLSRNSLQGDLVAISVPGQSGLARFVKLPPVEEKKIPDIVRFEAKQQIPFNLDEVVWDYQKIGSGAVTDGFAMETEIGLFAIKRDTVNRYLQHFSDVGVEVHIVQMSPLALCNFVSFDLLNKGGDAPAEVEEEEDEESAGKKKCVVALDIGTDNSNLVITDGERIIWQRPIPLGGNHFTRALTKDLKLTFAKAEHLKRNATKSPDLKKILLALRPVLNDFVGEVQRSLSYFTNTHRDAHVKYMLGLGNAFRLPGLQKFLGEKLQLDVRKLAKMNRFGGEGVVAAPAYAENVLSFAVAYGLALQGLKLPRLQTNLLPHEIRVDRMIRAKKPWAVAAAASLLFGTSILALGYGMQYRAVAHTPDGQDVLSTAVRNAKSVTQKASTFQSQYNEKNAEIEKHVTAVKSILAGSSERTNWLEFMKFVSEALPRPDGSNLLNDKQIEMEARNWPEQNARERGGKSVQKFYLDEEAELAFKKFIMQQTGAGQASSKDDDEGLEHLIQVNVASVMTLYSENLENVFTRLKNDPEVAWKSMRKQDQDKPPQGKGWVVELRGYTYHKDTRRFLEDAVVKNLATYRQQEGAAGAAAPAADSAPKTEGGEGAPTAPAAGGGTPTASGEAAAGGADADKNLDPTEPILNRVSHVVLFRTQYDDRPEGQSFKMIGRPWLDTLLTAPAGGAPGDPGAGGTPELGVGGGGRTPRGALGGDDGGGDAPGGLAGSTRGNWKPLGSTSLLGSGGGGLDAGGGLFTGRGGPGGEGGTPDSPGGAPALSFGIGGSGQTGVVNPVSPISPSGIGTPPKPGTKQQKLTRTEFVIIFVWKEPTLTDDLLGTGGEGAPADAEGGGAVAPAPAPAGGTGGGGGSANY